MNKFSQILRKAREDALLKQSDMAKLLNITPAAYGLYERAEREPKMDTLCLIADTFGMSVDELLGRSAASSTTYDTAKDYCIRHGCTVDDATVPDRVLVRFADELGNRKELNVQRITFTEIMKEAIRQADAGEQRRRDDMLHTFLATVTAFKAHLSASADA